MNYLDLSNYERITSEESWNRYLWGVDNPNAIVYHICTDETEVFVCEECPGYGETDQHTVICEVNDEFGSLAGEAFERTIEEAIKAAFVDAVGNVPMFEEACAEDAVNVISYNAYQAIFGNCPMYQMDIEQMAELQRIARAHVKKNIRFANFDWEEF